MPRKLVHAFVDACQRIVGRVALGELSPNDPEVNALMESAPHTSVRAEALVLDAVLANVDEGRQAAMLAASFRGQTVGPESGGVNGDLRLLKAAREQIESRYSDPKLTAPALARQVGVSQWHLGRHLVQVTGHGVRWHINFTRVQKARQLLKSTPLSIKEIAAHVGYKSSSELGRQFRHFMGLRPSDFRRRQTR